ncbi:thymidine kinase [Anaeramoeba flamelloides]|uniref:thymidine kinase n=1 Tax=Anaeramoeba flamelloides TaxID=1746091 RepID=A0ABQ8YWN7_9EUKA|nr:thymidine kinase [Anaeramoeba flamelloides]
MNLTQTQYNYEGKIHLIIGPVFSGKTTELIRQITRFTIAKKKCIMIKYWEKKTCEEKTFTTHNRVESKAIHTNNLETITTILEEYDIIGIDDAQFFNGLIIFCENLANCGKQVLVAGLNGTFQREPFGEICNLIPKADTLLHLRSVCKFTNKDASFSCRTTNEKKVKILGGIEKYVSVSRRVWFDLLSKENSNTIQNENGNEEINDEKEIEKEKEKENEKEKEKEKGKEKKKEKKTQKEKYNKNIIEKETEKATIKEKEKEKEKKSEGEGEGELALKQKGMRLKNSIKNYHYKQDIRNKGEIQLIIGPMFSGKFAELLRRIRRYSLAKFETVVIKHCLDLGYEKEQSVTHDLVTYRALHCSNRLSNIDPQTIMQNQVIGIDEGQLFPDIVEFSEKWANMGKVVIVAGLDGNFQREPFGQICNLIPKAESVVKLNAVCKFTFDDAPFTKRLSDEKEIIIIGKEKYAACSRKAFFTNQKDFSNK